MLPSYKFQSMVRIYIYTLSETSSKTHLPTKVSIPKKKRSSSNHPFSGENIRFREGKCIYRERICPAQTLPLVWFHLRTQQKSLATLDLQEQHVETCRFATGIMTPRMEGRWCGSSAKTGQKIRWSMGQWILTRYWPYIYIVVIKHMFIAEQTPPNNSLSFVTQNKMVRSYGRIPQSFHINVFWCGSLHKISLKMIWK